MLAASYELHKFYYNAKEVLELLEEKHDEMSQELGKDAQTVTVLKRKHEAYQSDLHTFKQAVSDKWLMSCLVLSCLVLNRLSPYKDIL